MEACGRLPLAVRIVAARLAADPEQSLRKLLNRLGDAGDGLDQFSVGDLAVTASFDLSYRELAPPAAVKVVRTVVLPLPAAPRTSTWPSRSGRYRATG